MLEPDVCFWSVDTYATVGTVSAPALLGGLVDLDVLDDQVGGIEALGVGVGLSVLEETEKDLGGLDGPAGLGDTESLACRSLLVPVARLGIQYCDALQLRLLRSPPLPLLLDARNVSVRLFVRDRRSLTLGGAAGGTSVAAHGDGLLVLKDVAQVGEGALELPSVDGLGGLAGVLERHTEVGTASAGALCVVEGGCSVTNLRIINFAFETCSSVPQRRPLLYHSVITHHFGGRRLAMG